MIDQFCSTVRRSRRWLVADFAGVLVLAAMTLLVLNLPVFV